MQNNLYLYPNLVKVRKDKMTQNELAKQIGISQQEISRYEKGEVKAPINYIVDLANCCGASVDYILGRETARIGCPRLDPDIENMICMYSKLSDENKVRVNERIKTLFDMQYEK